MRDVKLKLESTSFEVYKQSHKTQGHLEYTNTVLFLTISLPIAIMGYFDDDSNPKLSIKINLA